MKKRKNVLRKDFYMEISRTLNRFISIFLIVALGVAFFSGVRASEPDMRYTADDYYDANQLMDIRIQGTLGLTQEDVDAVQAIEGVSYAMGSYTADVLCWNDDEQSAYKVMADMGEYNQIDVIEGRLPETAGECLIDAGNLESSAYSIGDVITIESGDDSDLSDTFATDTFTIVGIGSSAEYISFSRGSTTIGDGELDGFLIVTADSFVIDYYTKIDVWVEGADALVANTDAYEELVNEVLDRIEETLADVRCEARYTQVYADAMAEISDAQEELDEAQAEADDELADALAELLSAEDEIADAQETLLEAQAELADAYVQISDGEEELADGWAEVTAGEAQLAAAQEELSAAETEIADALAELTAGEEELADGFRQYEEALAQYEEQLAAVLEAQEELTAAQEELTAAVQTLAQQKEAAYAAAEETAQAEALAVFEETSAEIYAQLTAAQEELETLAQSLTAAQESLAEIEEQLTLTDTSIAQLEEKQAAGGELSQEEQAELTQLILLQETLIQKRTELTATVQSLQAIYDAQYDSGMEEIAAGLVQLTQAKADAVAQAVAAADAQVDDLFADYEAEFAQNEELLAAQAQTLADGLAELAAAQEVLTQTYEQLTDSKQQLEEAKLVLEASQAELAAAYDVLAVSQEELAQARAELLSAETSIAEAREEAVQAEEEIAEGESELSDAQAELANGWESYEEGKVKAEEEIADAQADIDEALVQVAEISYPQWYVTDRTALSAYSEMGDNAERMKAIGQVFPVLFFLVAALISLTTMTRMVEEERTQIGTLKALGYGKGVIAKKYLFYALLATVGGSIVGALIGEKILPYIIINAYKIMYPYIPNTSIPYIASYALIASAAAIVCVLGATIAACYRELSAVPAELMRPVPPGQGHRILLERVTPLWKRISFTQKSALRNLFRYKKRFFMTIFGIAGCMGLMVLGFGLKDSISDISSLQYDEIQKYSAMVIIDEDAQEDAREELYAFLDTQEGIYGYKDAYMMNMDVESDGATWEAYLVVLPDAENLSDFLYFSDRLTGEEYTLGDNGVIICEKTADKLGVSVGDTIALKEDTYTSREVVIADICENYVGHYVYMTQSLYEEVFGEAPSYNYIYVNVDSVQEESLAKELLALDAVLSISYMDSLKESIDNILGALDIIVVVLIVAAGMLAFVVLYNLNNININERRRELASIKVLGFYDNEVAAYVYRENIYLTIIGIFFGCILGRILHQFVIQTVEIDSTMFGRTVSIQSYLFSIILTVVFTVFVNIVMFYKLRRIDMVESLKSVE